MYIYNFRKNVKSKFVEKSVSHNSYKNLGNSLKKDNSFLHIRMYIHVHFTHIYMIYVNCEISKNF